jgi:flagellar motor component MotA
LFICLFFILGAIFEIGISLYVDLYSLIIVIGGAVGFSLIKNNKKEYIINFGRGAVFFGWLGLLIGLIALTGGKYNNWGNIDKMGKAITVMLLPVFYGYIIKLVTMPFSK